MNRRTVPLSVSYLKGLLHDTLGKKPAFMTGPNLPRATVVGCVTELSEADHTITLTDGTAELTLAILPAVSVDGYSRNDWVRAHVLLGQGVAQAKIMLLEKPRCGEEVLMHFVNCLRFQRFEAEQASADAGAAFSGAYGEYGAASGMHDLGGMGGMGGMGVGGFESLYPTGM